MLAENPLIVVNSDKAPYLLDPFMFRILAMKHPALADDFGEKMKHQGFAAIVLERDPATAEGKTWYTDTHFGGEFLRDLDAQYALSFIDREIVRLHAKGRAALSGKASFRSLRKGLFFRGSELQLRRLRAYSKWAFSP